MLGRLRRIVTSPSLIQVAGIGLGSVGFGLAWLPLGFICAGVGVVAVGLALEKR